MWGQPPRLSCEGGAEPARKDALPYPFKHKCRPRVATKAAIVQK